MDVTPAMRDRILAAVEDSLPEGADEDYATHRWQIDNIVERIFDFLKVDCVCNVGAQECDIHPGRLLDKEQKIAFRKSWDSRVNSEEAARGNYMFV